MLTATQYQHQTKPDWTCMLQLEAHALMGELADHPEAQRLFDGSIEEESYAAWLAQTYHYVRWTAPLLAQTGRRMMQVGKYQALAELFLQRSLEELGDEQRLLADLKSLGWSRWRVERVEERPAVAAYVAWNRFTAESGSPTAFLGTAYVLEYLSMHRAGLTAERLIAHAAIPNIQQAVSFLRGHAVADGDHVARLLSALRTLTDRQEQATILLSARTTRALYTGFFSQEPL
jgi:thiaminase